jgi:hypothetical protein
VPAARLGFEDPGRPCSAAERGNPERTRECGWRAALCELGYAAAFCLRDQADPLRGGRPVPLIDWATVAAIEPLRGCSPRRAPTNECGLVFVSLTKLVLPGVGLRLGALFRRPA